MRYLAPVTLIILISVSFAAVGMAQTQDPCVATENRVDLHRGELPILQNTLSGRLDEHFYRFQDLRPGEKLTLTAVVTTNTSTALNMLMMWEIRLNQFTRIDSIQTIQSGGPLEHMFTWLHANFGDNKPTNICFKIGIFSEARPVKADYSVYIAIDRLSDSANLEAADKMDKATTLGTLRIGEPLIVSGHLSNVQQGLDHVDFYQVAAALGRGKQLTAKLTTAPENSYEIALLDATGYGLRSNKTSEGVAVIKLNSEDPSEKPYYLRISNQGGVGGGGPYTITIEITETTTITTQTTTTPPSPTNTTNIPTLSKEAALTVVYGSIVAVAAAAVIATVLTRRRQAVEVVEEAW